MSLEAVKSNGTASSLEEIAAGGRYKIGGMRGSGAWGIVYSAIDSYTDENVAIKIIAPNELAQHQMDERKLTETDAVRKEVLTFTTASHIVPRKFEREGDTSFIVMPEYERTLADILQDDGNRKWVGHGISKEDADKYLLDIATGLCETHTKMRRAHGDVKADNIMLDGNAALMTDFGSSTTISINNSGNPRDNIGFLYTRAPEVFKKGGRPNKESDVWAWASLAYRMYSGNYPFEEELKNNPDFYQDAGTEYVDSLMEKKLKKIPASMRRVIQRAGKSSPKMRPSSMDELISMFKSSTKKSFIRQKPVLSGLFAAAAVGAMGLFAALGMNQYRAYESKVSAAIEESGKFRTGANWEGGGKTITNLMFDTKVGVWEANAKGSYGRLKHFPSADYVKAKPGQRLELSFEARMGPVRETGVYANLGGSFLGKAYVAGYESESFNAQILPYDQNGQAHYGSYFHDLKLPVDLKPGLHQLIFEVYAPSQEEFMKTDARFTYPEKALSRIPVTILVGDLPKDEVAVVTKIAFSNFPAVQYVQAGNLMLEREFIRSDLRKDMKFSVEVPELGAVGEKKNFSDQFMFLGPHKQASGIMVFRAYSPSGHEVAREYFPVRNGIIAPFDNAPQWMLELPGKDFAERLIEFRKKYEK